MLSAVAVDGLPEVTAGDDLAGLIARALREQRNELVHGDVLLVAHKVVSKAEGRTRSLSEVRPGDEAHRLARELRKDPRAVQVVLDESRQVLRAATARNVLGLVGLIFLAWLIH